MSQVINTNIASLNAQRNLNTSQSSLSMALQRLSSGLRINGAKDDAAGLAISDRMTSQIRGLNQAIRNANDGISMAQTAEGALGEVGNILQRMRELAIQSSNATNSDSDRNSIQSEVSQLKSELTRISSNTTFNGQKVLNGAMQNVGFQVGAEANQTIGISIGDARSTGLGTQMVIADNATNGLVKPTSYNRFVTEGTTVGNAATSATDNGVTTQVLTVRDSTGNPTDGGTINVRANEEASVTAAHLNRIEGVEASAYNMMKLSNWTAGNVTTIQVDIKSGTGTAGVTQQLFLTGVDGTTSTQSDVFNALNSAINGNAALSAAGVVSGLDNNGNLVVRNNTGANLGVAVTSGTATMDVFGTTGASKATSAGAVVVGGQLNINMANGYSIESSVAKATGLFDASANTVVAAKESNIGISNVTTGDTNTNEVGSFGTLVGKAVAAATNGYSSGGSGETLKIRDASGTVISGGTITVNANDSAKTTVGQLNAIAGISATGSNFALVTSITLGNNNAAVGLSVNGISLGMTSLDTNTAAQKIVVLKEAATLINSNKTLQADGFAASITADGALKITNTSGADIHLTADAANLATMTAVGYDAAGAAVTSGAGVGEINVGGTFKVAMAAGYTIESSLGKATGLLNAAQNAAATSMATGVSLGNSVAAQNLTISGLSKANVSVARDDAANTIATKINAVTAQTGVAAEARTQAKLSNISAAGTVSFALKGTNATPLTISGTVSGSGATADMTSLANAINAKSDLTGVTARLADNNASILLEQKDGANIQITNFAHSAGAVPSQANINGSDATLQISGVTQSVDSTGAVSSGLTAATTLHSGGTVAPNANSTVIGGSLTFRSQGAFNVTSDQSGKSVSLKGGNSSLFAGFASKTNVSNLSSVGTVDVSTVDGANNAVSVIDAALTQVNSIRSALGAVQNRFDSTIASLTSASNNMSNARSRIQDADFAQETANLTRSQILQQAGVAMLAQSNQLPQMVLSLLK